jgi:hypothetical protein
MNFDLLNKQGVDCSTLPFSLPRPPLPIDLTALPVLPLSIKPLAASFLATRMR